MLNKLKHIILIGLIAIATVFFVSGQSIDMFIFKYKQNAIRKEIRKQIKENKALEKQHTFSLKEVFAKKAFIEHRKEIVWNNHYYDVVKIKFQEGKFVVLCISDEDETNLFASLELQIKKRLSDDPSNSDYQKNFTKDFFKLYYTYQNSNFFSTVINTSSVFHINGFSTIYLHLNIPPPKA